MIVEPLLAIACRRTSAAETARLWSAWRERRADLDDVDNIEVALLPAAWTRARAAGVAEVEAARLDGLQRKATLTTVVTLRWLAVTQASLRAAGIASAAAGGGAEVVLLGALSPGERSVRGVDLWVSRRDFHAARRTLGARSSGRRQFASGAAVIPGAPGLMLRSLVPSLPPLSAGHFVAGRIHIDWAGQPVAVLDATEAVFVSEVMHSARRLARWTRGAGDLQGWDMPRWRGRGGMGGSEMRGTAAPGSAVDAVERALHTLDRSALERLPQFDRERMRRLMRWGGWPG